MLQSAQNDAELGSGADGRKRRGIFKRCACPPHTSTLAMWMIAKALNLIALLGAVAWLARHPDWEPAVTSIGLFAALVGQELAEHRRASKPPKPLADLQLFETFMKEFPSDGKTTRFLSEHDLGAPFHGSALTDLDWFVERWHDAAHEFQTNELEAKRKELHERAKRFRERLSVNIGLVGNSTDLFSLGLDDFETRPDMLALHKSLNEEASEVYRAHQELVRASRRILLAHG